tara:strand:- start:1528 stop:2301 length:774 start_codon:yes stop_codon:yes gene_type:complete
MRYTILTLSIACATENQIIHDGECPSSDIIEETTVVEVNQCPDIVIPECPDVNIECPAIPEIVLSCPEIEIPECPKAPEIINKVECPEAIVNIEVPACPSMTCECPDIVIPECPSLDNVELTVTLDATDFLDQLSDLLNGNQQYVLVMENYTKPSTHGTAYETFFENTSSDSFIMTGLSYAESGSGSMTLDLNGDNTFHSLTQNMTGTTNSVRPLGQLSTNTGTVELEPGDTISIELFCGGSSCSGYAKVMMQGYYQ